MIRHKEQINHAQKIRARLFRLTRILILIIRSRGQCELACDFGYVYLRLGIYSEDLAGIRIYIELVSEHDGADYNVVAVALKADIITAVILIADADGNKGVADSSLGIYVFHINSPIRNSF